MILVAGLTALGTWGCGSDRSNSEPPSYGELRQNELEGERLDFIAQTRRELSDLKTQISRLETRIEHESAFVDADERAEWRQELFELRQEQARLQAELSRAENASREDWAQMRGTVGGAVDSLQAAVNKVGLEIAGAFSGRPETTEQSSAENEKMTCPRELRNADIAVQTVGNAVAVDVTAQAGQGNDVRTKVRAIAVEYRSMEERAESQQEGDAGYRDPNRSTSRENEDLEAMRELIAKVAIHDIEGGVRVLFTPRTGKAQELQRELTADATDLDNGNCPKPLRNMRSAESQHDASPKTGFSSPRDRVSSEATAPR